MDIVDLKTTYTQTQNGDNMNVHVNFPESTKIYGVS